MQSPELSPDSPMDKMKKILSSPISRKKAVFTGRYFGVHLEDLAKREGDTIPIIVRKVCNFIQSHGESVFFLH